MGDAPAFQLYAADFYMDTGEWTVDEIGIYTRLLFSEWVNGDLPTEPARLARIAGCSAKKFQKGWGIIEKKFIPNGNGRLINPKMEHVRTKQDNYRKSQSEAGKRGVDRKRELGIYPFNNPSSDPSSDPSSEKQALQPSSSSSSSSLDTTKRSRFAAPNEEEISESSLPKIKIDIDKMATELYETGIFPKANAFANKCLKLKYNARAILHTLAQVLIYKPKTPWGYAVNIMKKEDGNFNEADFRKSG